MHGPALRADPRKRFRVLGFRGVRALTCITRRPEKKGTGCGMKTSLQLPCPSRPKSPLHVQWRGRRQV